MEATNSELSICPHCGYCLQHDKILQIGAFDIDPRGDVFWMGKPLKLSRQQSEIIFSLASTKGRPISTDVLRDRIGHEGSSNNVAVQITRMRSRFAAVGAPFPVRNMNRRGYFWHYVF
jgi:DNA-binding response OmpR family regulator